MRSREPTATAVNRIRGSAGILGMIALMTLGAACTELDEITVEDVTGTWRNQELGSFSQVNEDGIYRIAGTIEGLEERPLDEGQWTLEGLLITYISSDESAVCSAGDRGIYGVELIDENRQRHVRQEDECSTRSTHTLNLERVP